MKLRNAPPTGSRTWSRYWQEPFPRRWNRRRRDADPEGYVSAHTLLQFFERAEPTLVRMEACPGSQWLARKLTAMGHTIRIIPAQFVKPYVKPNKNDIIDAAAIAEAVTRPTMRFVEIRSPEHVDLQAVHRVRDRMISQRTCLINQMRAFCLEYGIAIHQGAGMFKADLPRILADDSNDLTSAIRRILASTFDELRQLELRIAEINREIEAVAVQSDTARRLMTTPVLTHSRRPRFWQRLDPLNSSERHVIWLLG